MTITFLLSSKQKSHKASKEEKQDVIPNQFKYQIVSTA